MKTANSVAIALLLATFAPTAFADSLCTNADRAEAAAQFKQAQDLEKAGKAREASAAASKVIQDCSSDSQGLAALKKRLAQVFALEAEKQSHFEDAFAWYQQAGNPADAGRMQRKLVETKPDDLNTVSVAIAFFRDLGDVGQEKDMRAHAQKNVDKALVAEEKSFGTTSKDSLKDLERARDWAPYADPGKDRIVAARAEKRGDTLSAEDGRRFLQLALDYYAFAENKDKGQKVRDKARSLAKQHESKGEGEIASEYYAIAGDSDKANAVKKQTEQRAEKTEEARKKTFKKDQDDLEKELGIK